MVALAAEKDKTKTDNPRSKLDSAISGIEYTQRKLNNKLVDITQYRDRLRRQLKEEEQNSLKARLIAIQRAEEMLKKNAIRYNALTTWRQARPLKADS